MAITMFHVHLREQDAGLMRSERIGDSLWLYVTPEIAINVGRHPDEAALLLAALQNACRTAINLNAERLEPQPGAGSEYGMEAERG